MVLDDGTVVGDTWQGKAAMFQRTPEKYSLINDSKMSISKNGLTTQLFSDQLQIANNWDDHMHDDETGEIIRPTISLGDHCLQLQIPDSRNANIFTDSIQDLNLAVGLYSAQIKLTD